MNRFEGSFPSGSEWYPAGMFWSDRRAPFIYSSSYSCHMNAGVTFFGVASRHVVEEMGLTFKSGFNYWTCLKYQNF